MSSTERLSIVSRGDNIFAIVEDLTGKIIKENILSRIWWNYSKNIFFDIF